MRKIIIKALVLAEIWMGYGRDISSGSKKFKDPRGELERIITILHYFKNDLGSNKEKVIKFCTNRIAGLIIGGNPGVTLTRDPKILESDLYKLGILKESSRYRKLIMWNINVPERLEDLIQLANRVLISQGL